MSPRIAVFEKPAGILAAAVGFLIIAAACIGLVMSVLMLRRPDMMTSGLIAAGFAGSCLLGAAFINTWRIPMLVIRPESVAIPALFGTRTIPVKPGQPVGELLASSVYSDRRGGMIEDNKFVHFYLLDGNGALVELVALHRAAPELEPMRRAFVEIAGLRIDRLKPVVKHGGSRPDVTHWQHDEAARH